MAIAQIQIVGSKFDSTSSRHNIFLSQRHNKGIASHRPSWKKTL